MATSQQPLACITSPFYCFEEFTSMLFFSPPYSFFPNILFSFKNSCFLLRDSIPSRFIVKKKRKLELDEIRFREAIPFFGKKNFFLTERILLHRFYSNICTLKRKSTLSDITYQQNL